MSKVSFKKLLTGLALLASFSAQAASDGFYVTGQLGYGSSQAYKQLRDQLESIGQSKKKLDLNGLAGRGVVGYQIDKNFAIELGWSAIKSKSFSILLPEEEEDLPTIGLIDLDEQFVLFRKSAAVDLMLRALLPLEQVTNGFNLYGKLGVAYLKQSASQKFEDVNGAGGVPLQAGIKQTIIDHLNSETSDVHWKKLVPAFGLGISYEVAPNLSIELSWTRIQPVGGEKKAKRPGPVDFFALGISYYFLK